MATRSSLLERARWVWAARTSFFLPVRRSETETEPLITRVSVPAHVSAVVHSVPLTMATLLRPRVRYLPLRS